jgi:hypothetical protein
MCVRIYTYIDINIMFIERIAHNNTTLILGDFRVRRRRWCCDMRARYIYCYKLCQNGIPSLPTTRECYDDGIFFILKMVNNALCFFATNTCCSRDISFYPVQLCSPVKNLKNNSSFRTLEKPTQVFIFRHLLRVIVQTDPKWMSSK